MEKIKTLSSCLLTLCQQVCQFRDATVSVLCSQLVFSAPKRPKNNLKSNCWFELFLHRSEKVNSHQRLYNYCSWNMPYFMGHENSPNTTQNERHNILVDNILEACRNGSPMHNGFVFILQLSFQPKPKQNFNKTSYWNFPDHSPKWRFPFWSMKLIFHSWQWTSSKKVDPLRWVCMCMAKAWQAT